MNNGDLCDPRITTHLSDDRAKWPLPYFVPWYASLPTGSGKAALEIVNYHSLHLNMFEEIAMRSIWCSVGHLSAKACCRLTSTQHRVRDRNIADYAGDSPFWICSGTKVKCN
jgi:hypothetical protein